VSVADAVTYKATGKRKTSVARVILTPGVGRALVNEREIDAYFGRKVLETVALMPLETTRTRNRFDVRVNVYGGGIASQAGAVRHGIARALCEADESLRTPLKRAGFLTRDARQVERKKAGFHKARKKPQFSKR
jgi:small subunit ribosomal protein S9